MEYGNTTDYSDVTGIALNYYAEASRGNINLNIQVEDRSDIIASDIMNVSDLFYMSSDNMEQKGVAMSHLYYDLTISRDGAFRDRDPGDDPDDAGSKKP